MTALPNLSDLVKIGISKGTFKGALTNLRAHLAELLGVTGNQTDALKALGAPLNSKADKVGAYTVVSTDRGKVMSCDGTFTLSLSDAAALGDGFVFAVLNAGSGTITIDPYLTQQIDGATTKEIGAGKLLLVYCDGTKLTSVGGLDAATIAAALGYIPLSQSMTHGAVGSVCFAYNLTSSPINPGGTIAGSNLNSVGIVTNDSGTTAGIAANGITLAGVWRALGFSRATSTTRSATLYQRIS